MKDGKRLRASFLRRHGTGLRTEDKHKSGLTTSQSARIEFWVSGKWKRVDALEKGTSGRIVYSLNSEYGFRAAAARRGEPFVVTDVQPFDQAYWSARPRGYRVQRNPCFTICFANLFTQDGHCSACRSKRLWHQMDSS